MKRAELKAMGVRVRSIVRLHEDNRRVEVLLQSKASVEEEDDWCAVVADNFPTRKAAEQYARQLRRAMRGE